MGKHYSHLSPEERAMIQIDLGNGSSLRSVARRLGRSPSSVSRELARNRAPADAGYDATTAANNYRVRRSHSVRHRKLVEGQPL